MAFFGAGTETANWGARGGQSIEQMTFSFLRCLADCLLETHASRQLSHILIIWSPTIDDTENIFASLGKYLIENM